MSPRPDLGPKPKLGYTASQIERAADRRHDAAGLAALAADARAGAYVVGGELVVAKKLAHGGDPLFAVPEARALAEPRDTVFLGLAEGAGRFAIGIAPAAAETLKARDDLLVTDLRSIAVQGLVAAEHLPPIAEAKALLGWHARHRFCANCGAPTAPVESCLAGFIEPGESIEEAVRREVHEEAGIVCGRVAYFASQPWPFPMSLMIGCHAEALTRDISVDPAELEGARWFDREEAALMLLRRHPQGLGTPPPVAIAHHIIRAWVEAEAGAFA